MYFKKSSRPRHRVRFAQDKTVYYIITEEDAAYAKQRYSPVSRHAILHTHGPQRLNPDNLGSDQCYFQHH